MFPTCHGRNLLNKDDTAPLRRPRKAEAASTKKPNSTNCSVTVKSEDLPSSNARKTEGSSVYIARNLDEVTLRRPRSASTKNGNDITCAVPQKIVDVPACTLRNTEGGPVHVARTLEEVTLRRPRKAEAVSSSTKTANDTTCLVPQKREDVPTSNVWKTESASVCGERKTEVSSAPVSTKTNAVSSPPHVPALPLCASEEVSGPDHATLLLLRELLSRVQYSADDEEAQEHIHNLYRHLKVYGKMLDGSCKGELDSVFVVLRDLGRDSGLAYLSRLLLLELIELRAARWDTSPHLHSYYAGKLEKFPEIKMLTPSNTPSAVASVLSCLTTPKGFSPRGPVVENKKEETKRRTCQETITVCESLAAKVFESTEKIRRLEQRCRANLECYPDAEGEDCLVRITAESQDVINHAVGVIEEAIAEVELQERQRRRPPQADVWHRPRGRDMESADSWGTLQYSSYQDKIAARARYNGGTQMGNGTQVSPASLEEKSTYQKPVKEETTTLVFSSRQHQNILPARPVPESVPVITPTVTHVQDDLDWDDVDDNSELFVWKAHTTLASEVNRLAAVKEPNVGFDHQKEVPCGKIKTKKTKQIALSPTEKQNSSSCSTVVHEDRIPPSIAKDIYDNTVNTHKLDDVNSFSGGTDPIPEAVVQRSEASQTLKQKTNSEVVHKDRTPSLEANSSLADSLKHHDNLNSSSSQQGNTSQYTTPLSNGVKDNDAEKKTIEPMWAGWVDENTRSPMELSETAFFPEHVPSVDGDVQNRHTASTEHDPSPLSDSSVASLAEMMMMMSLAEKDQEGISEHTASSAEDWNEDDIYYSDEDDLLDALCENCCPLARLAASPESPDVIVEEFYSPRSSHTGLVTIREEKDEGAEDNNNSSNCEDTINNNNNKTDETEAVQDICSCSTVVEDGLEVNSRRSPVSLGIQGISEKAAVDVTSPSRMHEERQCVRSTKASTAEKPGFSLLGAFSATRPQFKLPRFLVNTIRQPLSPLYHQTVLDRSTDGCYGQAGNKHVGQRRFLFAKTAKLYYDHHPDQSEVQQEGPVQWEGPVKRYSRDVLLRLSHSPACSIKPSGLPPLPCVQ
ncbi:uncharacterized protein LOC118417551 [Branchiostoma floridae]|uniref:Uncharacterized protein LOC118417551 n=1 Tax=Branchiostoma floridae TaxID=7739 RepID=A0A9J7LBQ2_BRAFL|nr:uncharacterized protein LOC118417551 [Branchiostoma floridae]